MKADISIGERSSIDFDNVALITIVKKFYIKRPFLAGQIQQIKIDRLS